MIFKLSLASTLTMNRVDKSTTMKKLFLLLFSITIIFSACKRDTNNPNPQTPGTIEDLNINSDFNWKTTQDFQLTITGKSSNIVEVISSDGSPYLKSFIVANVPSSLKLTVPAYEDSVYLVYQGNRAGLALTSENLSYTFN